MHWATKVLDENISSIEFASEDASFRRYFRIVHNGISYIVMDAPTEHMSIVPFSKVAKFLLKHNVNVPEIYASDEDKGFMLITDFGKTTYLQILSDTTAKKLYGAALDTLINIQLATQAAPNFIPPYSSELLLSEMNLFPQWYLNKQLDMRIDSEVSDVLQATFDFLLKKALEQPKIFVHLDYHSRNLMYVKQNNPGVIDFQNAVIGPITYDLMSLLRDCYIVWSQEQVDFWIKQYLKKAKQAGLVVDIDTQQFKQWFDLMGIQRHIKVAGIFSRLGHRDNKFQFFEDIPTVIRYIQVVSRQYQELKPLHDLIISLN